MKPSAFAYTAPNSLEDALRILAEHGSEAKILAGGQSLIPAMNFRLASAGLLVDLNRIEELDYVRRNKRGVLRIGAMTRQRTVERSQIVAGLAPLIHETMPFIAHPQIRNRGTIGGSLVHADPAAELPVVMVALDAKFVLKSIRGEREVMASQFFTGIFTVDIQPDEILTEIVLVPQAARSGTAFMELARRQGDYAMMGIAVIVGLDVRQRCGTAQLVYLNAGEKPQVASKAAQILVGNDPSTELFLEAAHVAAIDEIDPMGNIHATAEYQRHLAELLTARALKLAFARASNETTV